MSNDSLMKMTFWVRRKYFKDVGEELSFIVVHQLSFFLNDHLEVGSNKLKLFSEKFLLSFLKHRRILI